MKHSFIKFLDKLKAHFPLILLVLLIAIISFLAGIEVQRERTIAALEDDTVSNLLSLKREVSNVIRSEEKGLSPSAMDVVVLRNTSANIRDAVLSCQIHHKTSRYPNSLLYLIYLNDNLQGTEDISHCVQQYAVLLENIPIDREAGLYNFMGLLETSLSTEEGQTVLQELQLGKGLVRKAIERSANHLE